MIDNCSVWTENRGYHGVTAWLDNGLVNVIVSETTGRVETFRLDEVKITHD